MKQSFWLSHCSGKSQKVLYQFFSLEVLFLQLFRGESHIVDFFCIIYLTCSAMDHYNCTQIRGISLSLLLFSAQLRKQVRLVTRNTPCAASESFFTTFRFMNGNLNPFTKVTKQGKTVCFPFYSHFGHAAHECGNYKEYVLSFRGTNE